MLFWRKVIVGSLIAMLAIPALFVWLSNKGPIADVVAATFKDWFERGIIAGIAVAVVGGLIFYLVYDSTMRFRKFASIIEQSAAPWSVEFHV